MSFRSRPSRAARGPWDCNRCARKANQDDKCAGCDLFRSKNSAFAVKPGDWKCGKCGANNFARRDACNKCATPKAVPPEPQGDASGLAMAAVGAPALTIPVKAGDWHCDAVGCNELNFGTRVVCRKCGKRRKEAKSDIEDVQAGTEEGNMCVICMDKPTTHAMVPCGHKCTCQDCAGIAQAHGGKCPMCRQEIREVIKVYNT